MIKYSLSILYRFYIYHLRSHSVQIWYLVSVSLAKAFPLGRKFDCYSSINTMICIFFSFDNIKDGSFHFRLNIFTVVSTRTKSPVINGGCNLIFMYIYRDINEKQNFCTRSSRFKIRA